TRSTNAATPSDGLRVRRSCRGLLLFFAFGGALRGLVRAAVLVAIFRVHALAIRTCVFVIIAGVFLATPFGFAVKTGIGRREADLVGIAVALVRIGIERRSVRIAAAAAAVDRVGFERPALAGLAAETGEL